MSQKFRCAIIGNPLTHSRSPEIHQHFAKQFELDLSYEAICVEPEDFVATLDKLAALDYRGVNITYPYKGKAWDYVSHRSPRAQAAKAVNTIYFNQQPNSHFGDSTDGEGILRDLEQNLQWPVTERVLILGAGGAAASVVNALAPVAQDVLVANRTLSKAEQLATQASNIQACALDAIPAQDYQLVISCLSTGLEGAMPELSTLAINAQTHCYDVNYFAKQTPFLSLCQQGGANKLANGFGMVVEQAASSFELWFGQMPDTSQLLSRG